MDNNCIEYDPHCVLIKWFTSKTEQRRIKWKANDNAVTASVLLPPILSLQFACATDASRGYRWDSFIVRDEHTELLHIDSNQTAHGPPIDTLFIAALKCSLTQTSNLESELA